MSNTKKRFSLDAKMKRLALRQGYDSISLFMTKEYDIYIKTGKIPRSIELQVLST